MLNNIEKENIVKILMSRLKEYECPMCHNHDFTILDQYGIENLRFFSEKGISQNVIGIPFIIVICKNCGFSSNHNMFALGLMNDALIKGMSTPSYESEVEG